MSGRATRLWSKSAGIVPSITAAATPMGGPPSSAPKRAVQATRAAPANAEGRRTAASEKPAAPQGSAASQ